MKVPYATALSDLSLVSLLEARALALGKPLEELIDELATAIASAAPAHYASEARFVATWNPERETFDLAAIKHANGEPGTEPGDELEYSVHWRLEERRAAITQDEAYAERLGFKMAHANFDAVVDSTMRDVLQLANGPLEALRDEWMRLFNSMRHFVKETAQPHVVELLVEPGALPEPITNLQAYDLALEGPNIRECAATARTLDTQLELDGRPVRLADSQRWNELVVSVLGQPELATLERWTARWMHDLHELRDRNDEPTGCIHQVQCTRYATGCELTVDFGSAPVEAVHDLVRALRPFGTVSIDSAALRALGQRTFAGTRDDVLPLVRLDGGGFSESLVGPLWIRYVVESRQSFGGLTPDETRALGIAPTELRRVAIENLRRRVPYPVIRGHGGVYGALIPGEGGHLEASLLLLDELWTRAGALVKGPIVVALPANDLLFFCGADDGPGLKRLREVLETIRANPAIENRLTDALFVREGLSWRRFT